MLQYKTTAIPCTTFDGATKEDFSYGLSYDTASRSVSLIGEIIESETAGGWTFHTIQNMSQRIKRKKTLIEIIFGWIPILNRFLCPRIGEATVGSDFSVYCLVFVREN